MAVKRIEALADGIAYLNKMHVPTSDAFQLRNPALAKAYSFRHLGEVDNLGRRMFTSFIGGYRYLIQDLEWKCSGKSRAKGYDGKLNSTSTLSDLLRSFHLDSMRDGNIFTLIEFLNNALPGIEIDSQTQLGFFLEGN